MRLRAYRNLNCKAGVVQWSIYSEALRCVIAHCDQLVLDDCTFSVDQSALHRMRHVLHKRNVVGWVAGEVLHAGGVRPAGRTERGTKAYQELLGALTEPDLDDMAMWDMHCHSGVRFDPWTMDTFQTLEGTPVKAARWTVLEQSGKCWMWDGEPF